MRDVIDVQKMMLYKLCKFFRDGLHRPVVLIFLSWLM
jgi:hypothetical protein